ncbi:hypothetical protein VTI28DRAFT_556 [Corynascus sepedonium]
MELKTARRRVLANTAISRDPWVHAKGSDNRPHASRGCSPALSNTKTRASAPTAEADQAPKIPSRAD